MMANLYAKFKEEDRPALGALLPLTLLVNQPRLRLVTVEYAAAVLSGFDCSRVVQVEHLKQQTSEWYSVKLDGDTEPQVRKGKPQNVTVTVEDRQGGWVSVPHIVQSGRPSDRTASTTGARRPHWSTTWRASMWTQRFSANKYRRR
jgi:hypothetical protein